MTARSIAARGGLRRVAVGVCALALAVAVAGCLTSRVVEDRDGRPWEITTARFLGLLTLSTDERPVSTPLQKTTETLRRPLRWAYVAGLAAMVGGVGLAVALRSPWAITLGLQVALAGATAFAVGLCGLYALALPWWGVLAGLAVGIGLIVYACRGVSVPAWIGARMARNRPTPPPENPPAESPRASQPRR